MYLAVRLAEQRQVGGAHDALLLQRLGVPRQPELLQQLCQARLRLCQRHPWYKSLPPSHTTTQIPATPSAVQTTATPTHTDHCQPAILITAHQPAILITASPLLTTSFWTTTLSLSHRPGWIRLGYGERTEKFRTPS